jgi:hypothetical protein
MPDFGTDFKLSMKGCASWGAVFGIFMKASPFTGHGMDLMSLGSVHLPLTALARNLIKGANEFPALGILARKTVTKMK